MAKSRNSLISFGSVASETTEQETNTTEVKETTTTKPEAVKPEKVKPETEQPQKEDENTSNQEESEETSINDILQKLRNQPKPVKKVQVSVYLDEDIAKEFDKYAKKNGKGSKSELINEFLKSIFKK